MKGAFYGRHSTDKQTMDTQRAMAYEIVNKYVCTIVKEYEDPGVSARKKPLEKREGISQLLKDALDGKFEFVVINNHDRFARIPMEHQKIRMTLAGCAIPVIVSSTESLYDSGDFIVDLIKDGTSKFEVDNTRIRTRDTIRSIVKKGKWSGGKAPFGYVYDKTNKTFSKNDSELDIVRRIYELYRNKEGFQSIATIIETETGKSLKKTAIRWILTNPFYAGYLSLNRKTLSGHNSITSMDQWTMVSSDLIEPIMTLEEWKETWTIYEQRKTGFLTPKMYKTSFLLSGLVSCSCGGLLICKDQTTFDKKRVKHYGNKWYCCKACCFKVESDLLHNIIADILKDLKTQNLDIMTELVITELTDEQQLITQKIIAAQYQLTNYEHQWKQAEHYGKQLMTNVKDLETLDENTQMVYILMLQKQHLNEQVERTQADLTRLQKRLHYLEQIEGQKDLIKSKLNTMSVMTYPEDNSHELRKMITYLVQHVSFTLISKNGKNEVTKASVAIQTRNNLITRTIP